MERRHRPGNMVFLSGWLFADLLLGLSLIFLASSEVPQPARADTVITPIPATATMPPTPTVLPSLTPEPTATPIPCKIEIRPDIVKFELEAGKAVGGGRGQNPTEEELKTALSDLVASHERVFLVVTFSHIPFDKNWPESRRDAAESLARSRAAEVNDQLFTSLPSMFVRGRTLTDVGKFANSAAQDEAKVDFWIWLRKDSCSDDANR